MVKPEAIGTAPGEMPFMSGTEAAVETAVFPRMRHVKPRIRAVMAYPVPVPGIDVRSIRMPRLIAEILVSLVSAFRGARGRRSMALLGTVRFLGTVRRNIAVAHLGVPASSVVRLTVIMLHEGKAR